MRRTTIASGVVSCSLLASCLLLGQQPHVVLSEPEQAMSSVGAGYILGPDDKLTIRALDIEEISGKTFSVDGDGMVSVPLVGRISAGGQTLQQFEKQLIMRLQEFVKTPQIAVEVIQRHSRPIFMVGVFRNPGVQQLQSNQRLLEFLATVSELQQPNGPPRITITRSKEYGLIPVSSAVNNPAMNAMTLEVNLAHLMLVPNAPENIQLQAYDVLSASRAGSVYVAGEFQHVGMIELQERDSIPITQLIAIAGGLSKDANVEHARILRPMTSTAKLEPIPVNIKRILAGKTEVAMLLPNDVLFVPRGSNRKGLLARTPEIILPAALSSVVIALIR